MKRAIALTALAVTMLAGITQCGEPCAKTKDKGTPPGSGRQVCDDKKTLVLR